MMGEMSGKASQAFEGLTDSQPRDDHKEKKNEPRILQGLFCDFSIIGTLSGCGPHGSPGRR